MNSLVARLFKLIFWQLRDSGDDDCEQGLKKDEHSDCALMCPEQNGNTRYYYIAGDSCMDSCPSHMTKVGDNNVCQCEEGKEENNDGDACELICQDSSLKYLDGDECKAECPDEMQAGTNDVCGPWIKSFKQVFGVGWLLNDFV